MAKTNVILSWILIMAVLIFAVIPFFIDLSASIQIENDSATFITLLISIAVIRVAYWGLLGAVFYWATGFLKESIRLEHQHAMEEIAKTERETLRGIVSTKPEIAYVDQLKTFIQEAINLTMQLKSELTADEKDSPERKNILKKLDDSLLQWLIEKEKSIKV